MGAGCAEGRGGLWFEGEAGLVEELRIVQFDLDPVRRNHALYDPGHRL